MNIKVLFLFLSAALLRVSQCNNATDGLCTALQSGEEDVKTILNEYLKKQDSDKDPEIQLKEIEAFLLKQKCIEKTEFAKGYLRTSPPIKQLYITTSPDLKIKDVTINFTVDKKEISVEKIIINRSL
jgi:hypothetical protein